MDTLNHFDGFIMILALFVVWPYNTDITIMPNHRLKRQGLFI